MTSGTIIINNDEKFLVSSIRSSGYIEHLGMYLFKFYKDSEKIKNLIIGGAALNIEAELEDVPFRGDSPVEEFDTLSDAIHKYSMGGAYYYFWDGENWNNVNPKTLKLHSITRKLLIRCGRTYEQKKNIENFLDDLNKPPTVIESMKINDEKINNLFSIIMCSIKGRDKSSLSSEFNFDEIN